MLRTYVLDSVIHEKCVLMAQDIDMYSLVQLSLQRPRKIAFVLLLYIISNNYLENL